MLHDHSTLLRLDAFPHEWPWILLYAFNAWYESTNLNEDSAKSSVTAPH